MKNKKLKKPDYYDYISIKYVLLDKKKQYLEKIKKERKYKSIILEIYKKRVKSINKIIKFLNEFYDGGKYQDIFKE